MSLKLQKINIDVEQFTTIKNANDRRPEQLLGGRTGSLTSQPVKPTSDQEYVRLMEERYGIREEGIF